MIRILIFSLCCAPLALQHARSAEFSVRLPSNQKQPLDGRLILILSTNDEAEPRFQTSYDLHSQQLFGLDVNEWQPDDPAVFDNKVFGYPQPSLADVPPGQYWVQALLHRYETFHRADGHTVKLPMDRGEGQQWNRAPGNLYSRPQQIEFDPHSDSVTKLTLTEEIPPIEEPPTTKYIKHIKIQSKLLSEFWGRPMHLGAHVLLPEGFGEHPDARYPLVIMHGHFPNTFSWFS